MSIFSDAHTWRQSQANLSFFGQENNTRQSHCAAFLILIPAIYMHKRPLLNYVIAFASVYAFDRVFRLVKTRVQRAHLRAMPELGMVRMEMRSLTSGWRVGQHVRIRVLSSAMGLVGWSEVHPFTIANAPGTSSGMVLMVKKTGRWTVRHVLASFCV